MKRLYLIGIIILISHSTLIAVLPLPAVNNMSGINADENISSTVFFAKSPKMLQKAP